MSDKCPFYPNDIDPCRIRNCRFLCNGGCAIQLAAYSYDSYNKTEEIEEKVESIKSELEEIKRKFGH